MSGIAPVTGQRRDESGQILVLVLALLILLGVLVGALISLAAPGFAHAAVVRNLNDTVAAADSGIEYAIQSLENNPAGCPLPSSQAPTINFRQVAVSCEVLQTTTGISSLLLISTAQIGTTSSGSTMESRAVLEINDRTGSATVISWRTCRSGEC